MKSITRFLIAVIVLGMFIIPVQSAFIDSDDNDLKNVFKSNNDLTNIKVMKAPDGSGGYLFYSTGAHISPITVSIPKGKVKKLGLVTTGIHTDSSGKVSKILIGVIDTGIDYGMSIPLSSTCVDCFIGTYTQIFTNQTNASLTVLSQQFAPANISTFTINVTSASDRNLSTQRYGINNTGLVLALKMDETTGTLVEDFSGNATANNCTWSGSATVGSSVGKFNNGTIFDANDDYLDCGNRTSLYIENNITISGWIYTKSWSAGKMLFNTGVYNVNGYRIYSDVNGVVYYQTYQNPGVQATQSQDNVLNNNTYAYLTVTKNGTKGTIYKNGVNVTLISAPHNIPLGIDNFTIGGTESGTFVFNGTIDEVRVWNRSLSSTEIMQNYLVRAQDLRFKTNSNATYSGFWNSSENNSLSIPFGESDSSIANISTLIPSSSVVDNVTVYDYNNNTQYRLTVNVGYTENTTIIDSTSSGGWLLTNISINHTNSGNGSNYYILNDADWLAAQYRNATAVLVSNNPNATITRNSTYYTIYEGNIVNNTVYTYNITDRYNNDVVPTAISNVSYYLSGSAAYSCTVTDPESNTINYSLTMNGATTYPSSCTIDLSGLSPGTYLVSLNMTDNNGTIGSQICGTSSGTWDNQSCGNYRTRSFYANIYQNGTRVITLLSGAATQYASTETGANLSWGAATLLGGTDGNLNNMSTAQRIIVNNIPVFMVLIVLLVFAKLVW